MPPHAPAPSEPRASEPRARRLVLVAAAPRSGSTWLFNAARRLLEEAEGPPEAAWIADWRPDDPAPTHLVKVHRPEDAPAAPDLVLTTHRAPEACLASLIRMGWLENSADAIRRAWTYQVDLQAHWGDRAALVIPYDEIGAAPAAAIGRIAATLGLAPAAGLADRLAEELARMAAPAGEGYDPVTLLHPRHRRTACETGPAPGEIRRIAEGGTA